MTVGHDAAPLAALAHTAREGGTVLALPRRPYTQSPDGGHP